MRVLAMVLALLLQCAACSDGGSMSGTATKKDKGAGSGSEDSEEEAADQPAEVAGAFLACGLAPEAKALYPAEDAVYGCVFERTGVASPEHAIVAISAKTKTKGDVPLDVKDAPEGLRWRSVFGIPQTLVPEVEGLGLEVKAEGKDYKVVDQSFAPAKVKTVVTTTPVSSPPPPSAAPGTAAAQLTLLVAPLSDLQATIPELTFGSCADLMNGPNTFGLSAACNRQCKTAQAALFGQAISCKTGSPDIALCACGYGEADGNVVEQIQPTSDCPSLLVGTPPPGLFKIQTSCASHCTARFAHAVSFAVECGGTGAQSLVCGCLDKDSSPGSFPTVEIAGNCAEISGGETYFETRSACSDACVSQKAMLGGWADTCTADKVTCQCFK